jgi:secreted trypsin-like serine protease
MKSSLLIFNLFLISACQSASIVSRRIFGGTKAKENEFPHHVALIYFGRFYCGGSIIHESWVLTATHCIPYPEKYLVVVAGDINLENISQNRQTREALRIIRHENYTKDWLYSDDIGLIEVEKPFDFTKSVSKIALCQSEIDLNTDLTLIGFGKTENGRLSDDLLKVSSWVQSNDGCFGFTTDGLICLAHEIAHGACNVSFFLYYY